jgi:lipopolysaccharide/colanic/teichoic acid biosynthesis glycosyltransferase
MGSPALRLLSRINGRDTANLDHTDPLTFEHLEQQVATPAELPSWGYRVATRCFDLATAAVVLVLTAPLIGLLAVLIRRDSPGPALFCQDRVGLGGKSFTMWKLRTMYVDGRERFPELYDYRCSYEDGRRIRFHRKADPRVTPLGRFLRRTSLDELPNFYSVLKGDMALVGPRPQLPELMPYYGPLREAILVIKPGIFSLPKVWFRDELELRETILLDAWYGGHRSLRLDWSILLRGIYITLARRYVY